MKNSFLRYFLLFVVLSVLQVLVFDNLNFLGFINPYVYVFFLLALPVSIDKKHLMLLAFVLGFVIDIMSNTIGIHIFASVLIAYFRNNWIKVIFVHTDYENLSPSLKSFGLSNYLKYASVLIFMHHLSLFLLESLDWHMFVFNLVRALCNTAVTLLLILLYEILRKE